MGHALGAGPPRRFEGRPAQERPTSQSQFFRLHIADALEDVRDAWLRGAAPPRQERTPAMAATLDIPEPLRTLRFQPLFALELQIAGSHKVGGSTGTVVGVVGGGRFEGERLRGRVLPGGSDWQGVQPDGTASLDCRLVLETDDGAQLAMTYGGVRAGPADVLARLADGEDLPPDAYYLRISPVFRTATPALAWLNRVMAVGAGWRRPGGPVYNVFELL